MFKVEEGGVISQPSGEGVAYSLNGVVTEGKLTLKQQFGSEDKFVDYEGVFENESTVKGTYKAQGVEEFGEAGEFSLNKA